MIPLRDSTPSQHFPLVTVTLILVNLLVFLHQISLGPALEEFIYTYGLIPANYTGLQQTTAGYLPFISSTFLHGSWMHVIGNMWVLWLFGDNVENRMGRFRFLLFYLLCGLIAGITHTFINPTSTIPVVGASGAVAGIMGAYFLMFHRARVLTYIPPFFLLPLPAWLFLGFWALSQLWGGAVGLLQADGSNQIAFWAHIGGFLGGMILYRFFLNRQEEEYY